MVCNSCGNNNPNSDFCKRCGNKMVSPNNTKKNNNIIIIFVLCTTLIIAGAIYIIPILEKKTVTCLQESEKEAFTIKNKTTVLFSGKKIKNVIINGEFIVKDNYMNYIDLLHQTIKEEIAKYSEIKGVTVYTNTNKNTVSYKIKSNKNSSNELSNKEFSTAYILPKEFVKSIQKQGYTCTIK